MATKATGDVAFAVTTDAKRLDAMVANVGMRTKSLREDIQICAISCVLHAVECGDCGFAQRLFDAVRGDAKKSAPIRQAGLKMWFVKNGPFGYAERKLTFVRSTADELAKRIEKNREAFIKKLNAESNKWWDAAGAEKLDAFDLIAEIEKLIKRAHRAEENPDTMANPKTNISAGVLKKLEALTHTQGAALH